MKRLRTVRQKLLAVVLVSTLGALVLALAAMTVYDLHGYRQGAVDDITTQADLIGLAQVGHELHRHWAHSATA